jgi:ATP synthase protein I
MHEKREPGEGAFSTAVGCRENRKLTARRKRSGGIWANLGLFGVVGWSVAIPTVLGAFAGAWVDLEWPGPPSWTLMLLLLGTIVGCANAWFWVSHQRRGIARERQDDIR